LAVEKLRRFAKRLVRANEKVVFALMVGVLIWRVVQIVYKQPPPIDGKPVAIIPIEDKDKTPERPTTSAQDPARFASVSVGRWTPDEGPGPVPDDDEPSDAGLPTITCTGTQVLGGGTSVWAQISVDGGKAQLVKPGSYFLKRQARLDKIDTDGKKIVFTWMLTNKEYERQITG
jgi:hypothetical protein